MPSTDVENAVAAVGLAVRTERSRRGVTRRALAYHAGISERYLADLERGKANVSLAILFSVAEALGCTAWSLLPDSPDGVDEVERPAPGTCGIALVGLRGGGKSTLGAKLARKHNLRFVRLGDVIEERSGMEQGEYISLAGQRAYRRVERESLDSIIATGEGVVLETGGSLVVEADTLNELLENFMTVWVRAEPEDHMQRVIDQGDLRPIAGHRAAMDDLNTMLSERERDYRRAHVQLMTSGKTVAAAFASLNELVASYIESLSD